MSVPVMETKLLPPRLRSRAMPRPRLEELLGLGARSSLTLVSAPAGFGKTTLLGTWLANAGARRAAWVSLDERDRDPHSFWSHVLHSVDRAAPGTASPALLRLQPDPRAVDAALTALLNELSVLPGDLTVVLDDYHLADGPDVSSGMTVLLDQLPVQVHVVIATRADPALPLARLRARGELLEIRAADLRFSGDEATAYLNDVAGLALTADNVAALEARTEGWAAALQLAALSLRGRDDASQFIRGFAGDDRYVVDYLVEEVLERQPDDVRRFLTETSVLERLTGPLCDAVTGRTDSRTMLDSLERQNLFVAPLDDHRRWYRYHHLFADVLRAHLHDERPGDVPELHRRAGDWYDEHDDPEPAVRHALAGGDVELAARRVEAAIPAMLRDRREATIRRWSEELPGEIVEGRPALGLGLVAGLMSCNQFDGVDQRLHQVEQALAEPVDGVAVEDRSGIPRLRASAATYRAALALVAGDLPGTVDHAERALALTAANDHLTRGSASALLGLAAWTRGDLEEAHRGYREASDCLRRAGHLADVVGCAITLADLEMTQGRLREARRTFRDAVELSGTDGAVLRGAADMYVGLSRVAWEQDDLADAAEHLRRADQLGEVAGLPQHPYRWRVALAQLRHAEGHTTTALGLLAEAERVYVGDFSPNVRPVAAVRARVLAATGDVTAAMRWAGSEGLSATDELSYLREYEHVTLVRILFASHATGVSKDALPEARSLLDRLLVAAEAGGRTGTVIELLALQAIAARAAGDRSNALTALARAVELAEPEGYVRLFSSEGAPMAELLRALDRDRPTPFTARLLERTQTDRADPTRVPPASTVTRTGGPEPAGFVEPLSSRELDVLRYLGSELNGPDIARELGVSLSTVRTHTQHIYTKLGVNNRRAAVRRAHQFDLFSHGRRR